MLQLLWTVSKDEIMFERRVPPAALDPLTTPNMINPFASQSPPLFLGMYVVYTKQ